MLEIQYCPDCGTKPGQAHLVGCDIELCSSCGEQALYCGCKDHDPLFARWTGFWPGRLEADGLGIGLNEFHAQYSKVFFIKPKKLTGSLGRIPPTIASIFMAHLSNAVTRYSGN